MKNNGVLAVISDIHVAHNWTQVSAILPNSLNPNTKLSELVDRINRTGRINGVIFNGDLIDYVEPNYHSNEPKKIPDSNWNLYYKIIGKLKIPFWEIPGNHDFRMLPYNYAIYKMKHVGVNETQRKKYKKEIGHHKFRYLLELLSIFIPWGYNPLKQFGGFKQASYRKILGRNCIFLNTGSDAYGRLRSILKFVLESIKKAMPSLDCEGITKQDIHFVSKKLEEIKNVDVLLFMHAPLLNSRQNAIGQQNHIDSRHMKNEIFLRGRKKLLQMLMASNGNISIIASHTHKSQYLLINKKTSKVKEVDLDEFNRHNKDPQWIKHLTTLPLGAYKKGNPQNKIGYLEIAQNGEFREVTI